MRTSGARSAPSLKQNTRSNTPSLLLRFSFHYLFAQSALALFHALRHRRYTPTPLGCHITQTQEQILAVGRGFDWLHIPNKALIVGPYRFASRFRHTGFLSSFRLTAPSYNLGDPIATAGSLLLSNLRDGRIPKYTSPVPHAPSLTMPYFIAALQR